MENKDLISVIIPFYNTEKYIRQCLSSLKNQTYNDYEIICVSDGSTDGSMDIVKEWMKKDGRIKLICSDKHNAGYARNIGIDHAHGDYFIFLDSDDFFEPDLLEKMHEQIVLDGADICICETGRYHEDSDTYEAVRQFSLYMDRFGGGSVVWPAEHADDICLLNRGVPWDRLYKRSLIIDNELRFQSIVRCNDVSFAFLALILAQKITTVDKLLVHHRVGHADHLQAKITSTPQVYVQTVIYILEQMQRYDPQGVFSFAAIDYTVRRINNSLYCFPDRELREIILSYLRDEPKFKTIMLPRLLDESDNCIRTAQYGMQKTIVVFNSLTMVLEWNLSEEINDAVCEKRKLVREKVLGQYRTILERVPLQHKGKKIAIYGMGKHTEGFLQLYKMLVGEISAELMFIDTTKKNGEYRGYPIINYKEMNQQALSMVIISSLRYREEMINNVKEAAPDVRIFDFYSGKWDADLFSDEKLLESIRR